MSDKNAAKANEKSRKQQNPTACKEQNQNPTASNCKQDKKDNSCKDC